MKKLGAILVGLSLVGASVMAANPVNSVNMVGYQNINVPANGMTMIALNWNSVGGSFAVPINTLIGTASLTAGGDFFTADQLYVWDLTLNGGAGGYKKYYIWNGDGQWYEFLNDALPTTNVVVNGHGFWLKHIGGATNLTISGEVPVVATNKTIFGAISMNMIGSAFSAPMQLNGTNETWAGNAGGDFFTADQMYVWDSTLNAGVGGYKKYYIWNGDGQWYEFLNDALPTTNTIPMGAGAWFKNNGPSATTWTETRPYNP